MSLEQFYDQHIDKVYKFFYVKCLHKQTAEDLTSATFTKFLERCGRENPPDNMKKYLYGIMRNTWADFLREKYRLKIQSIEAITNFEKHAANEVSRFEGMDLKTRALLFINRLPQKQQNILRLRLIEELTPKEIAARLGKSRNYVKITQRRALKRVKEMIRQPYLSEDNL